MKLMFADGSHTLIDNFSETFAEIDGAKVPAINILINDTRSLESIQSMFGNPDMLRSMSVYTDLNELVKTYTGYETRFSVNFYEGDTYGVILAKTSDTQRKVAALEATIERFNDYFLKVQKSLSTVQERYDQVSEMIGKDIKETVGNLTDAVGTVADNYATLVEDMKTVKEDNLNNTQKNEEMLITINNFRSTVANFGNITRDISNRMEDHVVVAGRIEAATQNAQNSASTAAEAADVVKLRLADFNNQTAKVSEENKKLSENVLTLSETAERHTEKLTNAEENIESLTSTTKSQEEALSRVSENLGATSKNVETLAEDIETAKETLGETSRTVAEVGERLSTLLPETDITKMTLEDAKAFKIVESATLLEEFLETHPVTSDCHGELATYSITEKKQRYLEAMILTTQMALANGTEYRPSWNASGQVCTYDWTLQQLQQLAMEIEAVVRPLVSKQQHIEVAIRNCSSIEELMALEINYEEALTIPGGETENV